MNMRETRHLFKNNIYHHGDVPSVRWNCVSYYPLVVNVVCVINTHIHNRGD